MSQIVLHLGMPKTGTTTLQADVYPFISKKSGYEYIGLWQPQQKVKQHPITSALHRWFAHGESYPVLRNLIDQHVEESPLLISNESILSSSVVADWRMRVERIAQLVRDYEISLYLTVRDPAAAMFSYYVEHFLDAPTGHFGCFADAASLDPRLQIYRYATSIPHLQSVLRQELTVESYEDIFSGRSPFLASLTPDGQPFPNTIGRHNSKSADEDEIILGRESTLRDRLRHIVYETPIGTSSMARAVISTLRPITALLDMVKLRPARIHKPTSEELARLNASLQYDIAYLREHWDIDYSESKPSTSGNFEGAVP